MVNFYQQKTFNSKIECYVKIKRENFAIQTIYLERTRDI